MGSEMCIRDRASIFGSDLDRKIEAGPLPTEGLCDDATVTLVTKVELSSILFLLIHCSLPLRLKRRWRSMSLVFIIDHYAKKFFRPCGNL